MFTKVFSFYYYKFIALALPVLIRTACQKELINNGFISKGNEKLACSANKQTRDSSDNHLMINIHFAKFYICCLTFSTSHLKLFIPVILLIIPYIKKFLIVKYISN